MATRLFHVSALGAITAEPQAAQSGTMKQSTWQRFPRVTGPLWRESTDDRWIPLIVTKSQWHGLWYFLDVNLKTVEQTAKGPVWLI